MQYAEVAVNVPVSMTFHYHIPPELAGRLQPGHLVRVSFGTAEQPGVVLTLSDQTPVLETKPVLELLDPMPVMDQPHIDTARWLSRETLAPLGSCLWLFLPPGIAGRSDVRLSLIPAHPLSSGGEGGLDVDSPAPQAERETKGEVPAEGTEDNLDPTVAQLLSLLARRGPLRGRQVAAAIKEKATVDAERTHETEKSDLIIISKDKQKQEEKNKEKKKDDQRKEEDENNPSPPPEHLDLKA
jgi:primosomal protein N'